MRAPDTYGQEGAVLGLRLVLLQRRRPAAGAGQGPDVGRDDGGVLHREVHCELRWWWWYWCWWGGGGAGAGGGQSHRQTHTPIRTQTQPQTQRYEFELILFEFAPN